MRPLLLLLVVAPVFAAPGENQALRIIDLEPAALAELPRWREFVKAQVPAAELPAPVHRLSDLPFLGPARKEKLDLYLPNGPERQDRPAVVFIHGGGFTGGDKAERRSASVSADLAREGYVVVSCNYVLGPKAKEGVWPQNIADCREAVRWVRGHAKELGVNPDRIAVAGGSAGGYLALMVGLSDDRTGPGGDPKATVSAKVAAVIDMYGVVNFSKHGKGDVPGVGAAQQAAYLPENQCDRADPPVLILHGDADATVDLQQSKDMAAALRQAKVDYAFITVREAPHTFDLHPRARGLSIEEGIAGGPGAREPVRTPSGATVYAETIRFLERTIGK